MYKDIVECVQVLGWRESEKVKKEKSRGVCSLLVKAPSTVTRWYQAVAGDIQWRLLRDFEIRFVACEEFSWIKQVYIGHECKYQASVIFG